MAPFANRISVSKSSPWRPVTRSSRAFWNATGFSGGAPRRADPRLPPGAGPIDGGVDPTVVPDVPVAGGDVDDVAGGTGGFAVAVDGGVTGGVTGGGVTGGGVTSTGGVVVTGGVTVAGGGVSTTGAGGGGGGVAGDRSHITPTTSRRTAAPASPGHRAAGFFRGTAAGRGPVVIGVTPPVRGGTVESDPVPVGNGALPVGNGAEPVEGGALLGGACTRPLGVSDGCGSGAPVELRRRVSSVFGVC